MADHELPNALVQGTLDMLVLKPLAQSDAWEVQVGAITRILRARPEEL